MKLKKLLAAMTAAVMAVSAAAVTAMGVTPEKAQNTERVLSDSDQTFVYKFPQGPIEIEPSERYVMCRKHQFFGMSDSFAYSMSFKLPGIDYGKSTYGDLIDAYKYIRIDDINYVGNSMHISKSSFSVGISIYYSLDGKYNYVGRDTSLDSITDYALFDLSGFGYIDEGNYYSQLPENAVIEDVCCSISCNEGAECNKTIADAIEKGENLFFNAEDTRESLVLEFPSEPIELTMSKTSWYGPNSETGNWEQIESYAGYAGIMFDIPGVEYGKTTFGEFKNKYKDIKMDLSNAYKNDSLDLGGKGYELDLFIMYTRNNTMCWISDLMSSVLLDGSSDVYLETDDISGWSNENNYNGEWQIPDDAVMDSMSWNIRTVDTAYDNEKIADLGEDGVIILNDKNREVLNVEFPSGPIKIPMVSYGSSSYRGECDISLDIPGITYGKSTFGDLKKKYSLIKMDLSNAYKNDSIDLGGNGYEIDMNITYSKDGKTFVENDLLYNKNWRLYEPDPWGNYPDRVYLDGKSNFDLMISDIFFYSYESGDYIPMPDDVIIENIEYYIRTVDYSSYNDKIADLGEDGFIILNDLGIKNGDVNDDGIINKDDITEMTKLLSSADYNSTNEKADVNGDRTFDIRDLSALIYALNP